MNETKDVRNTVLGNATHVAMIGPVQARRGRDPQRCMDYFRDVHGMIGARVPGFYCYWQHHFGPAEGNVFPKLAGISDAPDAADQFDAIAHIVHRSEDERLSGAKRGDDKVAGLVGVDEQNPFEATYVHFTTAGNSVTFTDRLADWRRSGETTYPKFFAFMGKRSGQTAGDFHDALRSEVAPAWAKSDDLAKLRLNLLEDYDASAWTTPNVDHERAEDKRYNAVIEMAFDTPLAQAAFFASDAYRGTEDRQRALIATRHAFPERAQYAYLFEGEPTLVAKRGYPAAALIEEFGAANQLPDEVTALVTPPFDPNRFEE